MTLSPRTSTRRRVVVIGTTLVVVLLTCAAGLVYFGRAGITGGGTTETVVGKWVTMTSASGVTTTTPTVDGSGNAVLPASLTFNPGSYYSFTGTVRTTGAKAAVAGVEMPGLPSGYTAEITSGCAMVVTGTTSVPVTVKITAPLSATAGSWTLDTAALLLKPTSVITPTDLTVTCTPYVVS